MKITAADYQSGIKIVMSGKEATIQYPPSVWQKFPVNLRKCLIDNLTYARTMAIGSINGFSKIEYETSFPLLKSFFDECHMRDMPRVPKWDYKKNGLKTSNLLKKFMDSDYIFSNYDVNYSGYDQELSDSAIIGLSFGKDSLLTYAIAEEIGLKPQAVFVKDMFDLEGNLKDERREMFEKEFKKVDVLHDDGDKLFWNKMNEFNPVVTNALNCYSLMFFPFAHFYKSKYIIFGNQQNMNGYFHDDEGFRSYASYDQTSDWTNQQDAFIKILSSGKMGILSLIEPIYNINTMHILHHRYPQYAKYQVSCTLDHSRSKKVWCNSCSKCAKIFTISKALNLDIKNMGFTENLFNKEFTDLYSLFDGKKVETYDMQYDAKEELLLAMYMAYKNGAQGYVMDRFKEQYLEEATKREDGLKKKYLNVSQPTTIPKGIKDKVMSIYKEETAVF